MRSHLLLNTVLIALIAALAACALPGAAVPGPEPAGQEDVPTEQAAPPTPTPDPVARGAGGRPLLVADFAGQIGRIGALDSVRAGIYPNPREVFAFAPNGERLALITLHETIAVVETATLEPLAELSAPDLVSRFIFTPDGHELVIVGFADAATRYDNPADVQVIDLASGTARWTGQVAAPDGSLAISPDGRWLAVGSTAHAPSLWELETGTEGPQFSDGPLESGRAVTFSPDGRWLLYYIDLPLEGIWMRRELDGGTEPVLGWAASGFSFAPAGGLIPAVSHYRWDAFRDNPDLNLYDMNSGEQLARFGLPENLVRSAAVSPAGDVLATIGVDTLLLWDVTSQDAPRSTIPVGAEETNWRREDRPLAFSPDGGLLAVSSPQGLLLLDAHSGAELARLETPYGAPRYVSFSPDGALLAAFDESGLLQVWGVSEEPELAAEPVERVTGTLIDWATAPAINGSVCSLEGDDERLLAVAQDAGCVVAYANGMSCEGAFLLCGSDLAAAAWDTGSRLALAGLPQVDLGASTLAESDPNNVNFREWCDGVTAYGARPAAPPPWQVYDATLGVLLDLGPSAEPASTDTLDVVVCHKEQPVLMQECGYTGYNTLKVYRTDELVQLVDYRSGTIFAEQYVQAEGDYYCPSMYNFHGQGIDAEDHGFPPQAYQWMDWVTGQLGGGTARTVVAAASTGAYAQPDANSALLADLPAGTPLSILARTEGGDWLAVLLPDFTNGWVRRADLTLSTLIDVQALPVTSGPASEVTLLSLP